MISDNEDQPLIIGSHLGTYAIVTVGRINNQAALAKRAFERKQHYFAEMSGGAVNPTELVATLIDQADSFAEGIAQRPGGHRGLVLDAAPDRRRHLRRPRPAGPHADHRPADGALAVSSETCAFPNLDYEVERYLGPGEIVRSPRTAGSSMSPPGEQMQICSFLWVYYGYPASNYEGINVEDGAQPLRRRPGPGDDVEVDFVAGIPDSGHRPRHRLRHPRRASPTGVRSSSTRRPGRAASCPRSSGCATWWRA